MASLLHSRLPLSHNHSSSSSPNSCQSFPCHLSGRSKRSSQRLLEEKSYDSKRSLICQSGIDEVTFIELPGSKKDKAELIGSLKLKLLVLKNLIILTPFCYFLELICLFLLTFAVIYVSFDACVLDSLSYGNFIILWYIA